MTIADPLFTDPPRVRITDPQMAARIEAHLDAAGEFCYVDKGLEEYDLYNPGGAALRCLESVRETLALVLHGNPGADLQREFLSYWAASSHLYADLPNNFTGEAQVHKRTPEAGGGLLLTTPDHAKRWRLRLLPGDPGRALVVQARESLTVTKHLDPGRTLETFRSWVGRFLTPKDLTLALSPATVDQAILAILSDNGSIALGFHWPRVEDRAFRSAAAARRHGWIAGHEPLMEMERMSLEAIDYNTVVNARLRSRSPLEPLSIAVIGCGAVGARVILDLVRSGAGGFGRPLIIVDPDTLRAVNLGRHVLGVDAVDRLKVDAMAEAARKFHPAVEVEAIAADAQDRLQRLEKCDLIVDATGRNPLALRLNDIAVERRRAGHRFPPILHAAVHGNGLAVQTILVADAAHACLKCLRPGHGAFKADPIKAGVTTDAVPAACGDGAFIPYAAAAPAMAAALAVQAVLEWAADPFSPGPRVRTRRLDLDRTVGLTDKSWGVDPRCPACRPPGETDV